MQINVKITRLEDAETSLTHLDTISGSDIGPKLCDYYYYNHM
jgi:hypothetical protein